MKNLFALMILLMFFGCKKHFFVADDKIIKRTKGYVWFCISEIGNMREDFFVPIKKIDTTKNYLTNFITESKECGFHINVSNEDRLRLLKYTDDLYNQLFEVNHVNPITDFSRKTIGIIHILPVEIEYADINPQGKWEKSKYTNKRDTTFLFEGREAGFRYSTGKRIRLFNIFPISSRF